MKKSLILGLLLSAATAMAGQIQTGPGFGPFNVSPGGEFSVKIVKSLGVQLGSYDSETKNFWNNNPLLRTDGTFQTFCIERGVVISPNTVYDAEVSQTITTEDRPLNLAAAWLYMQFAKGKLADYPYTDYPNRATADGAGALQNALWVLMGFPPRATLGDGSAYVALANSAVTALGLDPADPNEGPDGPIFPVAVLQLSLVGDNDSRINRQDILILTGVPDGGLTLSLLGMGLASLGFFSRRNRK